MSEPDTVSSAFSPSSGDSSRPDTAPPRQTSITEHTLSVAGKPIHYRAIAAWQRLFERDQPIAEMFHVAYLKTSEATSAADAADVTAAATDPSRPITFIFNGGPGAASAYLHMGALGPKRVCFDGQGKLPKPPVKLVDNQESWLQFTDLVFVDPIGTGFSRAFSTEQLASQHHSANHNSSSPSSKSSSTTAMVSEPSGKDDKHPETQFWEVERDLNSLGEFIQAFLSRHQRWRSPIFIAGESYGGFRVARLARTLQKDFGVGLSGAILISPALEFSLLNGNDYNLTAWTTVIPSLAAAAAYHGQSEWIGAEGDFDTQTQAAEQFAHRVLLPILAMGDAVSSDERQTAYQQFARLIGLPEDLVERHGGRIDISIFARELLRDERKILGVYDASITAIDPFPNRLNYEGSDPTLDGINRLFTGAINSHLRDTLAVDTELSYHLLSWTTFKAWKFKVSQHWSKQGFAGSVDNLRIGMTLNPYMQVYITHGIFDLVTPYFASNHLVDLMRLDPDIRANLTLRHFNGGHMFYSWDDSRRQWLADMQAFYQRAIA